MKQEKGTVPVSALVPAHSRRKSRRRKEFSAFAQLQFTVPVLRAWCRVSVLKTGILLAYQAIFTVLTTAPMKKTVSEMHKLQHSLLWKRFNEILQEDTMQETKSV